MSNRDNMRINDIPLKGNYEGYYWMSDSRDPKVLHDENLPEEFVGENPFVVEAELYDKDNHMSYSVHNVGNDRAIINCFDVAQDIDQAGKENIDDITYESNRMDGLQLRFLQYWEAEDDKTCPTDKTEKAFMKSLQMTKRVFVGFKNKEEEQK